MSNFNAYFGPDLGIGVLTGILAGLFFHQLTLTMRRRYSWVAGGLAAALLGTLLWSGPLGGADRFIAGTQASVAYTLTDWEMTKVHGELDRAPLTRKIHLSGEADEFQKGELVKLIGLVDGVSTATWSADEGGLPIVVEGAFAALLGFLGGLFVTWLVALHRRYNAQWNW